MNDKRFSWKTEKLQHSDDEVLLVVDNENKEWKGHILNIVDLLNEQQATISTMTEENKELGKNFEDLVDWASKIANRNVVLDEQIGQLQRENEQLRQLYKVYEKAEEVEEKAKDCLIQELKKENEQLRKELNDCEKFRHSVFKRMNELTDQLKEKEEDEKLYANEILELNKTKKEMLNFKQLGGDY